MKTRMRATLVAGTICAALALSACGRGSAGGSAGAAATSTPQKGGTITLLQTTEFSHLDPVQGYDTGVANLNQLLYSNLTGPDSVKGSSKIVPMAATDLGSHNSDASVWTFHLKDGLSFSNGKPITSKDVKFSVERSFEPKLAVGDSWARTLIKAPKSYKGPYQSGDLDSIETPDDKTIVFHLTEPFPEFSSAVSMGSFAILPDDPKAITVTSVDQSAPITSGPYEVKAYKRGSELVLVRNAHWKDGSDAIRKAYPDEIDFKFGLDAQTIDQRMLSDQGADVDAIGNQIVGASTVSKLQQPQVKSRVVRGIRGCTGYLALNTTKSILKDVKVRQAISYAISKKQVQDADGGPVITDIATTMLPPNTPGRKKFDLYPSTGEQGNVEKAKQLLQEAGVKAGTTLVLDTSNASGNSRSVNISEAIQQSLKTVGITVKINLIDASSYYQTIGTIAKQHDMAYTGWCPDWSSGSTFLPPIFASSSIYPTGNQNVSQFSDKAVDARIAEIGKVTDTDKANTEWSDLDKQILEQAPVVPLLYENNVQIVGSNVGGVYSDPQFAGGVNFATMGLLDPSKQG